MPLDPALVEELVQRAIDEDLAGGRDVTSEATVPAGRRARATLLAKQDLVVAGLDVVRRAFLARDATAMIALPPKDGDRIAAGTTFGTIAGEARALLSAERVALNFLQRMTGIATLTRRFVDAVAGTRARIRDTRKTTPGLRALEKYAVEIGGATPHRGGLSGGILIKDNHVRLAGGVGEATRRAVAAAGALPVEVEIERLDQLEEAIGGATPHRGGLSGGILIKDNHLRLAGGVGEATRRAVAAAGALSVEVEIERLDQLEEAIGAGAQMVLVDNFTPEQVREAVKQTAGRVPIEVSGGVKLDTVRAYAEAGCDFIAIGALTHSAPAADISLEIEPFAFRPGDVVLSSNHWTKYENKAVHKMFREIPGASVVELKPGDPVWIREDSLHPRGRVYGYTLVTIEDVARRADDLEIAFRAGAEGDGTFIYPTLRPYLPVDAEALLDFVNADSRATWIV